jgi:hypothetical protein
VARRSISQAIRLVNAVADGAGDEEVTPTQVAAEIRRAIAACRDDRQSPALSYLREAVDAVSDGMPADYVAMRLYAALGALQHA